MISGHLRFSFFLAAVLLYSNALKKTKFRHILGSLTAYRKLLFRHAESLLIEAFFLFDFIFFV